MLEGINKYKVLKVFVPVIMLIAIILFTCAYTSPQGGLSDIDNHWSKTYVEYLTNKGAINGYPDGTFRPDDSVTYGEAIKLVVASFNKNVGYGDVHWASNYLQYAEDTKIIPEKLYSQDILDTKITRKEVIYMVYQSLLNYASKPVTNNDRSEIPLPFSDVTIKINQKAVDYVKPIKECYWLGIVIGNDLGLMNPDSQITRAEMATILTRAYSEEYRSYPMTDAINFLPSNVEDYNRILAYMPNSFYEAGAKTFSEYGKEASPKYYFNPYRYDEPNKALNYLRKTSEQLMSAMLNVSYEMTDVEWNLWKQSISTFSDISQEQMESYIQYVKDNRIIIRGGTIMNPCTIGEFYISKTKNMLGIKGIINYSIELNANKLQYLTIAEYVNNKKGIIDVKEPQFIIMYLEETEVENPELAFYNFKYSATSIKYI